MNAPEPSAALQRAGPDWSRVALLALYIAVAGFTILCHAMWRDEIQAWLIARDSADLVALFRNLHYEGHGALWYLLLMPLTRISHDPQFMQVLHLALASTGVAIVLWRAPLSPLERALFPFGYFILYEYAVKSRSYALGCLLVFIFCALWHRRRHSPVLLALILALMANVGILFLILSAAALLALGVDRVTSHQHSNKRKGNWAPDVLAISIVCAGWAFAIATMMPPADSGYAVGWLFELSFPRLATTLSASSALLTPNASIWPCVASIAILTIAMVRWRDCPAAAIFLAASVSGLLAFFYTKIPGAVWHRGVIFIAFFAAVWIARISKEASTSNPSRVALVPSALFGAVLAFQAFAGMGAIWTDLHQPLSRGRDVARFIAAQGWTTNPIIGTPDQTTATVIGYLGVKRAYYPNGRRWGSFAIWDQRRLEPVDMEHALAGAESLGPAVTWIASGRIPVDPALMRKYDFVEVATFSGARQKAENYIIYRRSAAKAPGH